MSDDKAAIERVRALAREWAALEGDNHGAEADRRVGRLLLEVSRANGSTAEYRLGTLRHLAESWTVPGSSLFYPAAGQAVLDAIAGEPAKTPVSVTKGDVIRIVPERGPERVMLVSHVERHIITLTDLDEAGGMP